MIRKSWPGALPQRRRGGLPALALAALGIGGPRAALRRAESRLDASKPGWRELAAAAVCEGAEEADVGELALACALLALRPLNHPGLVSRALDSPRVEETSRFWLLAALAGTDTAAVRQVWRAELDGWRGEGQAEGGLSSWLAFARSLLGGWLTWEEFRASVVDGRLLDHATKGRGYRSEMEAVGLWRHPRFAKWYRQAVYEASHQPDVGLSFATVSWIRDFPGDAYLWEGLAALETAPENWWPLYLVRWTSDGEREGEETRARLAGLSRRTLCALSLLRPEWCEVVGKVLGCPDHMSVVRWLREARPSDSLDIGWVEGTVGEWAASTGGPFVEAVGALCSLAPPADYWPERGEALRRRAFLRAHLVPEMDRLMDNLFYLYAVEKAHFAPTLRQARKGRAAAIRALALWPERASESAPALLRLARGAAGHGREAAREALGVLAERTGVEDLARLAKRVDLAVAWSDGGLEGKSARVWWDIAGYRVRLTVADGEIRARVFSRERPLTTVPEKVRDDPRWEEVREARRRLGEGYQHFRQRFEQVMVEGTGFSGREFAVLLASPVARSLAARLVLRVDGQEALWGEPDPLAEPGAPEEMEASGEVTVVHPVELLSSGRLAEWQGRVIRERVSQPFKQVFREVYVAARGEERECLRFAGQTLDVRQAFALLKQRGYAPRRGVAVKEWGSHGLRAHVRWAAADEPVGKLLGGMAGAVTSGGVWFEDMGGGRLRLGVVGGVVFSETLRDADLLVSRAAAGELGFTSEETRRLRGSLVRYVARALGLTSVYVSEDYSHVIVDGSLAAYRVHLGSGSVLLERTRRSMDVSGISEPVREMVGGESVDAGTARIIGTVIALSQDDRIAAPGFREQIGPAQELKDR